LNVTAAEVIGDASVVTNFENLVITEAVTIDMTTYANNTFTEVSGDSAGAHALDINGITTEIVHMPIAPGAANAIDGSAWTGTSDSMTLKLTAAAGFDTSETTIAALENLTITTDDTNDAGFATWTVQLTATSLNTITISGDTGVALTGSGNLTTLNTIDASASTIGGVSTATTVAGLVWASTNTTTGDTLSYTGTNGADNLTGHANTDDTFSGGLGVDTLVYTGRSDTFTGGGGNDVFDINAVATSTSVFLTISDIAAGDTIDIAGAHEGAEVWNATELTLGANATLANYMDAACAGNGGTNSIHRWFRYGGDTYFTSDHEADATYQAAEDSLIKLSGSFDLKDSTFASNVLTVVAPT
jgi:S-layer protein